jgi:hypothetical protein
MGVTVYISVWCIWNGFRLLVPVLAGENTQEKIEPKRCHHKIGQLSSKEFFREEFSKVNLNGSF